MLSKYPWIGFVIFIAALNIASYMGLDDAKQEASDYCDNVKSGYWPDYKHTFYTECLK